MVLACAASCLCSQFLVRVPSNYDTQELHCKANSSAWTDQAAAPMSASWHVGLQRRTLLARLQNPVAQFIEDQLDFKRLVFIPKSKCSVTLDRLVVSKRILRLQDLERVQD